MQHRPCAPSGRCPDVASRDSGSARVPPKLGAGIAWMQPLFPPDRIPPLAEAAGLPLAERVDPQGCAHALTRAVERAVVSAVLSSQRAAPGEYRDLFRRVESQASELLRALGRDPDVAAGGEDLDGRPVHLHPFSGPLALKPALLHLLNEVRAAAPPHRPTAAAVLCWLDGNEWFEELRSIRRDLARGALPPEGDGDAEVVGDAEATAFAALGMLPEILGLLVALARRSVAVVEGDMGSIGRREDAFRRDLFTGLARAHATMFGVPPRARDKAGNPNPAAIAWTRAVLGVAVERLPSCLRCDEDFPPERFGEVLALSDATIARQLEVGCSRLRQPGESRASRRDRG